MPVNDAPVLIFIPDQQISEDDVLNIELESSDVDNESLSYNACLLSGDGSVNLNGSSLSFAPTADWYGSASINVSVSTISFIFFKSITTLLISSIDEFKITDMSALPVTIIISFEIFLFFLKILTTLSTMPGFTVIMHNAFIYWECNSM